MSTADGYEEALRNLEPYSMRANVTYHIRLPFFLALPSGWTRTVSLERRFVAPEALPVYGERPTVLLALRHRDEHGVNTDIRAWTEYITQCVVERTLEDSLPSPPSWDEHYRRTYVTATTQVARAEGEERVDADAYAALDRVLDVVNLCIRSYAVVTGDLSVHPISPEHLVTPIFAEFNDARDGTAMGAMFEIAEPAWTAPDCEATAAQEAEVDALVSNRHLKHPFVGSGEWRIRARRTLHVEGDYDAAIVAMQTSVEGAIFDLYSMVLTDEGKSESSIVTALSKPFAVVYRKELQTRLGGDWTSDDSLPMAYWRLTYRLRNEVVHEGRHVSFEDALRSESAALRFVGFLLFRLFENVERFPRAYLSSGAPDNENLSTSVRQHLERIAAEPSPYWWPHDKAGRDTPGSD